MNKYTFYYNQPKTRFILAFSALIIALLMTTSAIAKLPDGLKDMPVEGLVLQDFDSQAILIEHNADKRLEPASITKLMTAYVVYKAIESGQYDLNHEFTISQNARQAPGSRMFLEQDSKVSINNLLKGLVIQSGNDAAIALAEGIAGSEELFVKQMNTQAQLLGLAGTHYQNASGLPMPEHYTTAKDIATLASHIVRDFPAFYETYREKEFTWNKIRQPNRNRLLFIDDSVDGLKTGHTESAGYCLVASAKRGDIRFISVVLGAKSDKSRTAESKRLIDYGFDNFKKITLYDANQEISKQAVKLGKSDTVAVAVNAPLEMFIEEANAAKIKVNLVFEQQLTAPINKNQVLGEIVVSLDGQVIKSQPIIAMDSVEELGFFKRNWRQFWNWVTD